MKALRPLKKAPYNDPRDLLKTNEVPVSKRVRALLFENPAAPDPKFRYGVRLVGDAGKQMIFGELDELKNLMTDLGQRGVKALDELAVVGKPTSHLWLGEKAPPYEPQPVDPMKKPIYGKEELPDNNVLTPEEMREFERYQMAQRVKSQEKAEQPESLVSMPEGGNLLTDGE